MLWKMVTWHFLNVEQPKDNKIKPFACGYSLYSLQSLDVDVLLSVELLVGTPISRIMVFLVLGKVS